MLSVTWLGKEELVVKFAKMNEAIHTKILQFITGFALKLQAHVTGDKLQGQVLNHISGKLAASIHQSVDDQGNVIIGRVYSASINYAAIHEYGGQIPDREAVNAKAMHWMNGGADVFAKFAKGFTMPERSYLRSSLADYESDFIDGAKAAVMEGVQ